MHNTKLDHWVNRILAIGVLALLLLIPFHAFLTVWLSQSIGHYTLLRLWKEILLVLLALGSIYILAKDKRLRSRLLVSKFAWLIGAYLALLLLSGVIAYATHHVTAKALGYGWIIDGRFLVWFLVVWVIASRLPSLRRNWPRVIFWPAAIVVIFGLLQYFILPYNFMTHFGYSSATIFPYEDINHNAHYIRIMSTLRGANPLGAYLVVVISLLVVFWHHYKKWWLVVLTAASAIALILTFSRGAWIGLLLSAITLLWVSVKTRRARQIVGSGAGVCALVIAGSIVVLRHNVTFQNIFFHTQTHSAVASTSDQGHASALQGGLHDILHEPLGRGPGTAGPASVYNTGHPGRIAENYFVQIGQEMGWIGLGLFLTINLVIARLLWRRCDHQLAVGLLAALVGVSFVNLLSHGWADDTLAYVWWGLAAMVVALATSPTGSPRRATMEGNEQ